LITKLCTAIKLRVTKIFAGSATHTDARSVCGRFYVYFCVALWHVVGYIAISVSG